jgi:branched-chain amino acid transport system substrate-binding protein
LVSFAKDPQSDPRAKSVVQSLKAQGFNADGPTVASFAAVQIYASAAVQVGAKSGHAIADFLRSGAKFETALGTLSFDATGEVQPPRITWYRWTAGAYRAETQK